MNSQELVQYIRDARIFNIRQLEIASGLSEGTLAKAVKGERQLKDDVAKKILFVLEKCGFSLKK